MTSEELALLEEHAVSIANDMWVLNNDGVVIRSAEEMVRLIEACMILRVPVSEKLSSTAWSRLVFKVAQLENIVIANGYPTA